MFLMKGPQFKALPAKQKTAVRALEFKLARGQVTKGEAVDALKGMAKAAAKSGRGTAAVKALGAAASYARGLSGSTKRSKARRRK